ncbi:adult-specific rigid cuticular protein 15.7 [Halyomorpha halys]|uniref:adult-specific rigid cuticular protein 15.7 n=1 Tax=Halyomorpha halys TaxID=286706 RepID=UPI0006D525F9
MSLVFFRLSFLLSCQHLVFTLPLEPRLTLAEEWNSYYTPDLNGPGTYTFGFDMEDAKSGNVQYRVEEKYANGTVVGSYGLVEPDGNVKVVEYVADHLGYRAKVSGNHQRYPTYHPPKTSIIEPDGGSIDNQPPRISALQPIETIGQNIQEQHKPPKYQRNWPRDIYHIWPGLNSYQ